MSYGAQSKMMDCGMLGQNTTEMSRLAEMARGMQNRATAMADPVPTMSKLDESLASLRQAIYDISATIGHLEDRCYEAGMVAPVAPMAKSAGESNSVSPEPPTVSARIHFEVQRLHAARDHITVLLSSLEF